ncbi:survival of motor neuron-related-splicing factor 30-like [Rhynchophorus ferrugineus]|uniref:survival of motor neuron-related-splicing factor 30-like n=1 Tax=Rhynchophorus ferrugineus TaxID=354439 RepID=UPI003FCDF30C
MSDELQNYQLQLQQVEAALLSDPNNEELKKLKVDLEEVIELTLDLKNKAEEAANLPEYTEPVAIVEEEDEITRSLLAVEEFVAQNKNKKIWRVGDVCMAKWSEDGQYYEAKIDVINPNGQVNVTFETYKNRGVAVLSELREFTGQKRTLTEAEKFKKSKINKEYLKKKKLKKQQRFKELEEEREVEKKKWLAFANKAIKTKKSGLKTRSIFASPDTVNGRVGIGTCGISGKPMTEFATAEKWRKGV